MDKTREEAREAARSTIGRQIYDEVGVPDEGDYFRAGYNAGFRDGAASVDRIEIVRAAFKGLLRGLDLWVSPAGKRAIRQRMDAVIAATEKGK